MEKMEDEEEVTAKLVAGCGDGGGGEWRWKRKRTSGEARISAF